MNFPARCRRTKPIVGLTPLALLATGLVLARDPGTPGNAAAPVAAAITPVAFVPWTPCPQKPLHPVISRDTLDGVEAFSEAQSHAAATVVDLALSAGNFNTGLITQTPTPVPTATIVAAVAPWTTDDLQQRLVNKFQLLTDFTFSASGGPIIPMIAGDSQEARTIKAVHGVRLGITGLACTSLTGHRSTISGRTGHLVIEVDADQTLISSRRPRFLSRHFPVEMVPNPTAGPAVPAFLV